MRLTSFDMHSSDGEEKQGTWLSSPYRPPVYITDHETGWYDWCLILRLKPLFLSLTPR